MQTYTAPTRSTGYLSVSARSSSGRRQSLWAAVALLWLIPAGANAWTETQIVSVSASVDARAPRAHVALDLGVRVREGWVSRFDLLDLGADLALDEPPQLQFVGSDGSVYTPIVQFLPGNGVSLQFPDKRSAPKRGEYSVQLTWNTRLANAGASEQLWSLPRWPERVPNVHVKVLAPLGARPSPAHARAHDAVEFRDVPEARASVLSYVRAELPRTAHFDVAWSLPAAAQRANTGEALWNALGKQPLAWWLGACLSLLWLLKWTLRAREPVCADAACSPQLPAPGTHAQLRWRSVGSALGGGLAVALFDVMPLWAAGIGVASCLWAFGPALQRSTRPTRAGTIYRFVDQNGCAFLDVTTPVGASVALLICGILCWLRPFAPSTVACSACMAAALLLGARGGSAVSS